MQCAEKNVVCIDAIYIYLYILYVYTHTYIYIERERVFSKVFLCRASVILDEVEYHQAPCPTALWTSDLVTASALGFSFTKQPLAAGEPVCEHRHLSCSSITDLKQLLGSHDDPSSGSEAGT